MLLSQKERAFFLITQRRTIWNIIPFSCSTRFVSTSTAKHPIHTANLQNKAPVSTSHQMSEPQFHDLSVMKWSQPFIHPIRDYDTWWKDIHVYMHEPSTCTHLHCEEVLSFCLESLFLVAEREIVDVVEFCYLQIKLIERIRIFFILLQVLPHICGY